MDVHVGGGFLWEVVTRGVLTVILPYQLSTQLSTLFHKTIGYNRLAHKIAIANLGGPVKRKINWKEKKGKEKEGKLQF